MANQKFLDPPPASERDRNAFELLRVWVAEQGQHISLRPGTWEDPFAWGIMLADLAHHIVDAEVAMNPEIDEEAFLDRLLEGFDSEMESPTDEATGEIM